MNFNYSYRAFLITSLLFGILFLGLYSLKLGSVDVPEEPQYDVEYIAEELQPTPKEEIEMPEMARVETNRAYNEAERYISNLESQRETPEETTEEKLKAIDDAISSSNNWLYNSIPTSLTKPD